MFLVSNSTPEREADARAYLQGSTKLSWGVYVERGPYQQVYTLTSAQREIYLPEMSWNAITIPEAVYYPEIARFPGEIQQTRDITTPDKWNLEVLFDPDLPNFGYIMGFDLAGDAFRDAKFSLILFARDTFGPGDTRQFAWLKMRGYIVPGKLDKGVAVWQMNSNKNKLQGDVIEVTSPVSSKNWDDPELAFFNLNGTTTDGYPARVNASVSGVGPDERRQFVCPQLTSFPPGRFTDGSILWMGGANAGEKSGILDFDSETGTIILDRSTPYPIQPGHYLRATIKPPQTIEEWRLYFGTGTGFPAMPGMPTRDQGGTAR